MKFHSHESAIRRTRRFTVFFYASVFVLTTSLSSIAGAQASSQQVNPPKTPGLELTRPGDERPLMPEYESEETKPELKLPPIPPSTKDKKRISDMPKVFVRKFEITGATVFSSEELAEVTAPFENREITFEELQEVRRALTLFYVNKGYINSGAVIPDQPVVDGIITIRIIEGVLSKMELEGARKLREDYVLDRLAPGAGPPLNINDLQKRLRLLQGNPLIDRVNAELKPGLARGESSLNVRIVEANPHQLWLRFGNNQSPSVGENRGEVQYANRNVSGYGDTFGIRVGRTISLTDFDIYYARPLNARDTTIKIQFRDNESTVVEVPFGDLDIISESETQGITLSHPFYKTTSEEFSMALTLERRRSRTYLLGRPYSFDASADKGETRVTVLRFKQNWTDRSLAQVVAVRSTFNLGIDALDSTINDSGEDSKFLSWLGQFQWTRRFGDRGNQVTFRTDIQLSRDPLLSLERFAIGGGASVRGYRENQLVRDNGLVASLELLIPVISYQGGEGSLQLAPFVDYGRSWNTEGSTPDPDYIASYGLGLRWSHSLKTYLQFYWGNPLVNVEQPGNTLQERGFHFLFSSKVF